MQYVAHRGSFCCSYHIAAQLCDVKTVLVCNLWHKVESSASVITKKKQLCNLRTVLDYNLFRTEETSASVIT
jgi:hypothetical protein